MSDRELYLNVDLGKAPAGTRVELKATTVRYKATNGDSTFLCNAIDVNTYIEVGILREVPPKWANDEDVYNFVCQIVAKNFDSNYVERDILMDEIKLFRASKGL